MFRFAIAAFITLIAVACGGPRYVDYFPYHDDGTPKPKVALMPILDSSDAGLSWDMTEELSQGIYTQLMNSGEFYVPTPREIGPVAAKCGDLDFFASELPCVREFANTDFIVAMEVIEHSVALCDPCSQVKRPLECSMPSNRTLSIRVRIKVIDIRCEKPKIVLYEIFKTCYTLTQSRSGLDCDNICWGAEDYEKTPYGIAHDRLIRNLSARLEEVIWSVR